MNIGHLTTAWTIRIALVCYVAALGMLAVQSNNSERWRTIRALWTVGCVFFVGHVIAAFSAYHHWSHQAAFADTAKQTKELVGWEFGYGIFVSYIFTVVWILDAAWWWLAEEKYLRRPVAITALIHAFLLFIAFNGAVIFKSGLIRAGGIVASVALAYLFVRSMIARMRKSNATENAWSTN